MPYVDDLVARNERVAEVSSGNITSVQVLEHEVASRLFPGIELPKNQNLAFLEFVFCNSLPKRNERGRAFTPNVLANSFASLNDQLIDYEHLLGANGIGSPNDRIIGHVKATRFNMPQALENASAKEIASLTDPVPAYGLGVLFMRASGVERIVSGKGKTPWKTSMECGHNWSDACFLYENEFIPVKDAEIAMRDCVGKTSVKRFRDRDLTICLGGQSGKVDFWGVGLTQSPADDAADILSITSGRGPELASKNIFYMPMFSFSEAGVEVANKAVDKKLEEYASISIIGKTEPDVSDGHTHEILSNMQILPAQGHSHYGSEYILTRGSNPRLTGITDTHREYPRSPEVSSGNSHDHCHLIDVPLKGKYPTTDSEDDSEVASKKKEEDMAKTMEELVDQLEKLVTGLSTGTDAEKKQKETELASLRDEIKQLSSAKATEEDRKNYVDSLVKEGKYVTKEQADADAQAAADKVKKELEDAAKVAEIRNARLLKCTEAGLDLETEFDGVKAADGSAMTLRKRLDMISVDDAGEQQFGMDFALWNGNPAIKKEAAPVPEAKEVLAEAASKGTPRKISLVGGSSEQASTGDEQKTEKKIPAHLLGRRRQ